MSQWCCSYAEFAGNRKNARNEAFLSDVKRFLPWTSLQKHIEPFI